MKFLADVKLVQNPWAKYEDKADETIPPAILKIYEYAGKLLEKGDESPNVDRCSAANSCPRQRQLKRQGHPPKPMAPRALINFKNGDVGEIVMKHFVHEALVGPGNLYSEVDFGEIAGHFWVGDKEIKIYKQQTLSFMLDGKPITGHADGFGKRNSDGHWELIEFKTYANYGFQSFKSEGVGDYIKQSHALMMTDECRALGVKSVRFIGMRKETGHLWEQFCEWDEAIAKQVVKEFRQVRRDEPIPAPYGLVDEMFRKKPTGRKIAQNFPCGYCPFLEACHGKHELDWASDQWGNKKPVYVFSDVAKAKQEPPPKSNVVALRIAPSPSTSMKINPFKIQKTRKE